MAPTTIKTSCTSESWEEDCSLTQLPRLTPAQMVGNYPEIKGKGKSQFLNVYLADGNCVITGAESYTVEDFGGKKGSFIAIVSAKHNSKTHELDGSLTIVEGSGEGELAGLKGRGTFKNREGEQMTVDYFFEVEW